MWTSQELFFAVSALLCFASGTAFVSPVASISSRQQALAQTRTCVSRHFSRPSMSLATPPPSIAEPETTRSNIQSIRSHDDFIAAMAQNQDKYVVIEFYDQFCRACDEIRPRYEALAQTNSDRAVFFDLEFSVRKDLCKQLGIKRLPTVQIYSGSKGRVADLPAGPSRFTQVEKTLAELLSEDVTEPQPLS